MHGYLWWYSHRYRDADTAKQIDNLLRARERYEGLCRRWKARYPERVLVAWWLDMAEAGVSEETAWRVIATSIGACEGIVLDIDGRPASDGMLRERGLASGLLVLEFP